jgi:3-deoxy-7-phosphoheptulonate synthase
MIIQFQPNITDRELRAVEQQLQAIHYKGTEVRTQAGHYMVAVGKQDFDIRGIGHMSGIRDIHRVSDAYKLVSKKWKLDETAIDLGDGVKIGNGHFETMAGPCSIESPEQVAATLEFLKQQGVRIMRGGVYKPRSSPYSFRGLGMDGLRMWHEQAKAAGIKIITEVMMVEQIEEMFDYIDIFQVGARNAQNFNLLDALGAVDKPVLLKRGISGTIDELLQAAEYIFSNGNERIMLCERGIRTYEKTYRNCFDVNSIAILKDKSHLPVVMDPSHGIGIRKHVPAVALAGLMAGADGMLVEVHPTPEKAFSDGQQTLSHQEAELLFRKIDQLKELRL